MTNDPEQKRLTATSFSETADHYLDSSVHREGSDLELLAEWCRGAGSALDIATGAGHTAGAVGDRGVREILAVDASLSMVKTAVRAFDVEGGVVDAERLPFESGSFDAVACRIAAHHFPDPEAFVSEVSRVLCADGVFAFEDNVAPEDDSLGKFINKIEQLRDPTHVESYTTAQWTQWLTAHNFSVEEVTHLKKRIDFDSWTEGQSLSPEKTRRVERELLTAPPDATSLYEIQIENGSVKSFANIKTLIRANRIAE